MNLPELDEMTADERARVLAAAEQGRPVQLVSPAGRTVTVYGWQVAERLDAGYTIATPDA
ncbi:hypothetical protein [Dactylosporangium sp. CA-139066]|uniref:hypothetical protein n=1 Tax=Dactylosporangium sp. CA-139066 TaxID=3239930 RepID=UPI003D8EC931